MTFVSEWTLAPESGWRENPAPGKTVEVAAEDHPKNLPSAEAYWPKVLAYKVVK